MQISSGIQQRAIQKHASSLVSGYLNSKKNDTVHSPQEAHPFESGRLNNSPGARQQYILKIPLSSWTKFLGTISRLLRLGTNPRRRCEIKQETEKEWNTIWKDIEKIDDPNLKKAAETECKTLCQTIEERGIDNSIATTSTKRDFLESCYTDLKERLACFQTVLVSVKDNLQKIDEFGKK